MIRHCNDCNSPLSLGQNWTQGAAKNFTYLCRACVGLRSKLYDISYKTKRANAQRARIAIETPEQHEARIASSRKCSARRTVERRAIRAAQTPAERLNTRLEAALKGEQGKKQSDEHKAKRAAAVQARLSKEPRICVECNAEFIRTSSSQKYCSGQCWNRQAKRKRPTSEHRIKVSPTLYRKLLEIYGDHCNICGAATGSNGRKDRLAVDHDHDSGEIRGLLCHRCNTCLGLMRDNPDALRRAIDYLVRAKYSEQKEAA